MPIVPLFGAGFYSKSANVTRQQRTNLYMEVQKDNDKTPMALYGTPGLTLWTNFSGASNPPASTSPSRGMIEIPDVFSGGTATVLVSVHGNRIYGFDSNGNYWNFAGVDVTYDVRLCEHRLQRDRDYARRWHLWLPGDIHARMAASWSQIVDADFPANPGTVAFLNSYFIVQQNGSGRFYWTNDATATNWDPLDFATAETSPDNLVALASDYGQIYLLGQKTTEVWGATGDASVWRRIGGAAAEWGLIAQQSVAKFDTGLVFLAANKLGEAQVVRINGYQIVPITDSEVSNAINKESVLSTATGFSYMIDGHAFYQINFSDKSFLYDGLSGLWSMVSGDTNGGRHRAERRAAQSQKPYVCRLPERQYLPAGQDATTRTTGRPSCGKLVDAPCVHRLRAPVGAGATGGFRGRNGADQRAGQRSASDAPDQQGWRARLGQRTLDDAWARWDNTRPE